MSPKIHGSFIHQGQILAVLKEWLLSSGMAGRLWRLPARDCAAWAGHTHQAGPKHPAAEHLPHGAMGQGVTAKAGLLSGMPSGLSLRTSLKGQRQPLRHVTQVCVIVMSHAAVCFPCVCALRMLLFHLKRKGRFLSCEAFSLSRFRKPQSLNHAVPQRQTGNGSCRPGTGLVAGQNEALWQVAEICLSNCKCISLWPIKLECILESL